ncbi:hypothetical protein WMY93_012740 [Mugilogobius chulae]|uniref:Guanylate cyclase activator 2B n=1 Tax=Mugilogobius chulae TaxID=88201 RepID=A0AAW0P1K8_9GOBI
MKTTVVAVAVLILALGWTSEAVEVEENGMSFSLEAVRRLQELTDNNMLAAKQNPRLRSSTVSLCADPMLPQEFLPCADREGHPHHWPDWQWFLWTCVRFVPSLPALAVKIIPPCNKMTDPIIISLYYL